MNLKVMNWNIQGAASYGWERKLEKRTVDAVLNTHADVFILTEFILMTGGLDYLFQELGDNGYIYFISVRSGKNGIMIGVKENLIKGTLSRDSVFDGHDGVNFLKVILPLTCGNVTIIGCRIEVGNSLSQAEYDDRLASFEDILLPLVKASSSSCIVCGDFNNAQCRGDLSKAYNPEDYYGKCQIHYNLNLIKDKFADLGFSMANIAASNPVMTYKNKKGSLFPLDHIFIRGFSIQSDPSVVWHNSLSDHGILTTTVKVE